MIGLVHSIWAVLPPVITIILALATKEVYTSLFTGVLVGSFMYSGFNIIGTIDTVFKVMNDKIGGNVYILMFMVMLGIFVAAVNKSVWLCSLPCFWGYSFLSMTTLTV